ncbi:MAG: glycosyltransferase family 4 protein [Planctomycetota bacterium]
MNKIVYISFDRFPSPKGAATHIDAFVRALGQQFRNVDLVTFPALVEASQPKSDTSTEVWSADGVQHHAMDAPGANLFERVLVFRTLLWNWWKERFGTDPVTVLHVRSIFEGYPIAREKREFCRKLVFEVNGLPSIELKYRYPRVAEDHELLAKLKHQEQVCLEAADVILTVSQVNADCINRRGIAADRIHVIPNGVDTQLFDFQPASGIQREQLSETRPMQILYSGTMAPWQGVNVAIEALSLFRRDAPAELTLVGHAFAKQRKMIESFAWENGVLQHVRLLPPVSRSELCKLHHQCDAVLAPLIRNDRNLEQGCCPLKVLEAMSTGCPLVASDLPVVRELAQDEGQALLVRPGSGKAIKDALFRLVDEPGLAERLSAAGRENVVRAFTWDRAQKALISVYEELLKN